MAILTPMESLTSIHFSTIIFPYSVTSTAWILNVRTLCLWSCQWDQDALWHSPSSPNPSSLPSSNLFIEWRKQKKKNKNTQWDNTLHRGIKILGLHFSLLTNLSKLFTVLLLSVQFSYSVVSDSLWPHESQHARPPCPSPTPRVHPKAHVHELVMTSNHPIFCHPLLLLPSIFLSIRVISNDSALRMRWPKYWS